MSKSTGCFKRGSSTFDLDKLGKAACLYFSELNMCMGYGTQVWK